MAKRANAGLPFDGKGGVVAIQRRLLDSSNYLSLASEAKALMTLMQVHWKNDAVAYGVREAALKIPCAKGTAQKAFKQLQERGFIEIVRESQFSSRTQSKTRTWRLTWMPYLGKKPTNEWEEIIITGSKIRLVAQPQGQKLTQPLAKASPQDQKRTPARVVSICQRA